MLTITASCGYAAQPKMPSVGPPGGGFHKVRYYGFLSANSGVRIEEVRWLASCALRLFFVIRYGAITPAEHETRPPLRCARCGGELLLVLVMDATGRVLVNHRQRFLDSG